MKEGRCGVGDDGGQVTGPFHKVWIGFTEDTAIRMQFCPKDAIPHNSMSIPRLDARNLHDFIIAYISASAPPPR